MWQKVSQSGEFVIVSLTWLAYFLSNDYLSYINSLGFFLLLFLSDEEPMLETLDYTICIGNTPTFLYFDLYLYSAYAGHHVYYTLRSYCQPRLGAIVSWVLKQIPEVSILFLANQNLLSKSWWRNCCLSSNSKSKIKFEPFYKNPYKKIILANLEKSRFIYTPGNTGNIFLQLATEHCCVASWKALLHVLPPTSNIVTQHNFVVASWKKICWKK